MLRDQLSADEWLVRQTGFDPERANFFETLFTVGNGRLGTRGTLEEGHRGELSGTYLSGVYDDHDSPVVDLVNAPDWLCLAVRVDGVRLDVQSVEVVSHERALDLRQGLLWRATVFEDGQGRRTRLETLRFASFRHRHLCALRADITPENHDSPITVESGIDGRRRNLDRLPVYPDGTTFPPEVKWEKWAHSKHLDEVARAHDGEVIYLEMRTINSRITLGYGAALVPSQEPARRAIRQSYERIEERAEFAVGAGQTLRVDKLVTIATSRDDADDADGAVRGRCLDALAIHHREGFDRCLADSSDVWEDMWSDCDCEIVGDPEATQAVRFGVYQLLIAANGADPTVNVGAKSLSGEGYRGHVFWDTEIMMLPFFIYTQPETARMLLRYRHHTLPGARERAREDGMAGARFPWESADTGREECPTWTADGAHRLWMRDEEVHVSADVAYGVLSYVAATGDTAFLLEFGAEILFETSRFWVDRVDHDAATDRYVLSQVMGPDEFHSHVDNNSFTNLLVRWHLTQAVRVHEDLSIAHPDELAELAERIGLLGEEVGQWRTVADRITYPSDPDRGLIEQFDGYFRLKDVPITEWDANDMPRYPVGYHHFNCEDTMLLKQPDVIMLTYLLPDEFSAEVKRANFDFYEARTLHKSSLSPAIHAVMGIEVGDATRAVQYFFRSALVDLADNQGNTAEGVHIASAGGTWQALVCGFGGFRVRHGVMTFNPWLPDRWQEIRFGLRWRGSSVGVSIGPTQATFHLDAAEGVTERILVRGEPVTLTANTPSTVELFRRRPVMLSECEGVLFDLDGVLTSTTSVHERAWARMFTEFFAARRAAGHPVAEYSDADYFAHIDGKPRYDGVRSLLASRGIALPEGAPQDAPTELTVAGLGNRKNELFRSILREEGVQAFPGSVALLEWLQQRRTPVAVVSSSRNAPAVLSAAGLASRFDVVVDGARAADEGLAGKPAPDTYLRAAALLGVAPERTVVVEDAISGVRAGHCGGFWVVGVDRGVGRADLLANGADVVVGDLAELVER